MQTRGLYNTKKHLDPLIKEMYLEGKSYAEITKATGIKRSALHYVIKERLRLTREKGFIRRIEKAPTLPKATIDRINQLYYFGYKSVEIADDLGLDIKQVQDVRDKNLSKSA